MKLITNQYLTKANNLWWSLTHLTIEAGMLWTSLQYFYQIMIMFTSTDVPDMAMYVFSIFFSLFLQGSYLFYLYSVFKQIHQAIKQENS
jgi:hypothetical protein